MRPKSAHQHRKAHLVVGCALVSALAASQARAIEKASEQVSAFYGSFSHGLPVELPGFRGLEPKIGLHYSSEGRNGLVGVGWGLSGFSTIQRANPGLGTPKFDAADIFMLDGQELVACQTGSVSPSCTSGGSHSTKVESYLKIQFNAGANNWTVFAKDGTRTVYSPIITVPPNALVPGGTLRWGVSSTIDTDGNTVAYSWSCPSGEWECYASQATYNGYSVTFHREARPDVITWAGASVLGQTRSRLKSIVVALGASKIRGYKLLYQTSPLTGRSLLASVQMFGKDLVLDGSGLITGGTSLPAHTFAYQNDAIGKSFTDWPSLASRSALTEPVNWANLVNAVPAGSGNSLVKTTGSSSSWDAGADSTRALASGNGYLEWTASEPSAAGKAAGLSNGNSDATLNDIDYAFFEAVSSQLYASENGTLYGPWSRSAGDVLRIEVTASVVYFKQNGVVRRQSTRTPLFPLRADASLYGTGNTIQAATISGDQLTWVNSWCQAILMTGDFNGDGRTDQLCYTTIGTPTTKVVLASASGFGTPTTWSTGFTVTNPIVADFNNDGKADLAAHQPWSGEFQVALSAGTSFSAPALWGTAVASGPSGLRLCGGQYSSSVGTGDFNGDGITDVYCKYAGYPDNFIGLSNGSSAFTFGIWGQLGCDPYGDGQGGRHRFRWRCPGRLVLHRRHQLAVLRLPLQRQQFPVARLRLSEQQLLFPALLRHG